MEEKRLKKIIDFGFKIGIAQIRSEIEELSKLIIKKNPTNMLEIGSKLGGNTYILSQLCQGIKLSIDLVEGEHGGWILQLDHPYLDNVVKSRNNYFADIGVLPIIGNSHSKKTLSYTKYSLEEKKLELLYIDGDHTYEGSKQDFEMYSPLVSKDGLVIFHDINKTKFHEESNNQVWKFWKELKGNKIRISANKHWGGIGIWIKN